MLTTDLARGQIHHIDRDKRQAPLNYEWLGILNGTCDLLTEVFFRFFLLEGKLKAAQENSEICLDYIAIG